MHVRNTLENHPTTTHSVLHLYIPVSASTAESPVQRSLRLPFLPGGRASPRAAVTEGSPKLGKILRAPTVQEKVDSAVLTTSKPHALALPRAPKASKTRPKRGRKPPRRCGLALAGSAAGRSRLGGGSARLANPQRRCAAGMSRRARHAAGTSHRTATFRWKTATKACRNAQRTVGKAPGFFLPNPGVFGTPSVTVAHVPADQVRRKGRETPY